MNEIKQYINEQLSQGKTEAEIKNTLLSNGWQQSAVDQAFGVPSSGVPQPPAPPQPTQQQWASSSFAQAPASLPSTGGLQNLDKKYVWVAFISYAPGFFPIGFFMSVSVLAIEIPPIASLLLALSLAIFGIFVLPYLWAKLVYKNYHYELNEEGFRKEYGVINKRYASIPYQRIQNVNIHRGIIDRMLGLSTLKIFTAGTGMVGAAGAEGLLPGLTQKKAEELRSTLIGAAKQSN